MFKGICRFNEKEIRKTKEQKKEMKTEFTQKDILGIRDKIDDFEVVGDDILKSLLTQKEKIGTDEIAFSKLFIECYDIFMINIHVFENEDKKFAEKLKIVCGDDELKVKILRGLVSEYGGGNDFGDHNILQRIKQIIDYHREEYMELIKLFFRIFGEND